MNKGGSFKGGIDECRASWRGHEQQVDYHYTIGVRVVREVER